MDGSPHSTRKERQDGTSNRQILALQGDDLDKDYAEYFKTRKWLGLRKRVLKRDDNRCVLCYSAKQPLQVHHRTYLRFKHEKLSDLYTLCESCHTVVTNVLRGRRSQRTKKSVEASFVSDGHKRYLP